MNMTELDTNDWEIQLQKLNGNWNILVRQGLMPHTHSASVSTPQSTWSPTHGRLQLKEINGHWTLLVGQSILPQNTIATDLKPPAHLILPIESQNELDYLVTTFKIIPQLKTSVHIYTQPSRLSYVFEIDETTPGDEKVDVCVTDGTVIQIDGSPQDFLVFLEGFKKNLPKKDVLLICTW